MQRRWPCVRRGAHAVVCRGSKTVCVRRVGDSSTENAPATRVLSPFRSFDGSLAEVRAENVPSAKTVLHMIPSAQSLRRKLPSAQELEERYITHEHATITAPHDDAPTDSCGASTAVEAALFGDADEDRVTARGVRAGRDGRVTRQHVLLAYRALFWGTVYAVVGFAATVGTAMYLCGYRSWADLQAGMRAKVRRDERRLQAWATAQAGDEEVRNFVIDLGGGRAAWQQITEVWRAVQELAEEAAAATPHTDDVAEQVQAP